MQRLTERWGLPPGATRLHVALALVAAVLLAGCSTTGAVVGAGAAAGIAVAQERSVRDAARDTGITLEINHNILQADLGLYADIRTDVVEGRVLLTGSVRDVAQADRAVALAWQADGVREVINEIQIAQDGDLVDYARDRWIAAQLRTRLLFNRDIIDINYALSTLNGVVYVIGLAQDQTELERVMHEARTVAHVRRVVSHVWLKDDPRRVGGTSAATNNGDTQ